MRKRNQRALTTGVMGAVGIYLSQLSAVAGIRMVAATSSYSHNEEFLQDLRPDEAVK